MTVLKRTFLIILLMAGMSIDISAFDVNLDSALSVLDREISVRHNYYKAKEAHISSIRQHLNQSIDDKSRFEFLNILFDQYHYYQSDSAFQYSKRMADMADAANDSVFKTVANASLATYYTSVWMLDAAHQYQQRVDESLLPEKEKVDYYNTCVNLYYRLKDAVEAENMAMAEEYGEICNEYQSKILSVSRPGSFNYEFRKLLGSETAEQTVEQKIKLRFDLINDFDFEEHEQAIIYASISPLAVSIGDTRLASYCNAMSAICDIRSSTHETSAVHTLAQLMNNCDDSERAVRYIMVAFDDALFFNSRTRQSQIGSLMPMLESIRYENLRHQKRSLTLLFVVSTLLLIGAVVLLVKLKRRNRRLEQMKGSLDKVQGKLVAANSDLSGLNNKLKETISERNAYIMQSLRLNTDFLNLLENRCRNVINEVKVKGVDSIRFLPYHLGIKEERQRIMECFDNSFLQLFPDFIAQLNNLFVDDQQISLNVDGSMPTELRIFALMRLGVVETKEVAEFLNISQNSIYVYKAKIKSKSTLPKSEFDKAVMAIKQT